MFGTSGSARRCMRSEAFDGTDCTVWFEIATEQNFVRGSPPRIFGRIPIFFLLTLAANNETNVAKPSLKTKQNSHSSTFR